MKIEAISIVCGLVSYTLVAVGAARGRWCCLELLVLLGLSVLLGTSWLAWCGCTVAVLCPRFIKIQSCNKAEAWGGPVGMGR